MPNDLFSQILSVVAPLFAIIMAYYFGFAQFNAISDAEKKSGARIAQAESKVESKPDKIGPAWDLARANLEKYFDINIAQVTAIFRWSIFVMFVGFATIIWGIKQAIDLPDSTLPAVITGSAGVITELIGATFLFIYRSTMQQAEYYTKMLERINSVGMAMQILDTIPKGAKDDDLKNSTKAIVVKMFMQEAYKADLAGNTAQENT